MIPKIWTVVRFPSGAWSGSGGNKANIPEYSVCEVYLAKGDTFDRAKKRAQAVRSGLVKKGAKHLPTQQTPFFCDWEAAIPSGFQLDDKTGCLNMSKKEDVGFGSVPEPVIMAMEDPVGTESVFARMAAEARGLGVNLVYLNTDEKKQRKGNDQP